MKFELLVAGPYDLTRCAWALCRLPSDGTDLWVPAREVLPAEYRRVQILGDEPVLTLIQQEPSAGGEQARLTVRTHPPGFRKISLLKERVGWQFQADLSLKGFYARARRHPFLRALTEKLHGVKPLRPSTVFEMAAIAISEQQISLSAAVKIRSRLVQALGERVSFEGREYRAFPTPQALARCSVQDLRALSLSARKAEFLIDLARKVAEEGFDLEGLKDRTHEEVISTLTALRGFGRWSAEHLLSRGLGRAEGVAGGDLEVKSLVGKYLGPGRRVSEKECRKILEEWGPHKRWVVFYLCLASRLGLIGE